MRSLGNHSSSLRLSGKLGLLPPPLAGEGWGGGERARSIFVPAPSLTLPRKRERDRPSARR